MNFIGEYFIEDISICDEIINFFKYSDYSNYHKKPGETTDGINANYKDSIDLSLMSNNPLPDPCLEKYIDQLQQVCEKYIDEYPWCNNYSRWSITEGFNIQYYKPGGGFKQFHSERISGEYPNATRHLTFQTYLNDVDDGGETEFFYQKLKVKAEKGKTLIWPTDWTHTHRGIVSNTEEKFIITGWLNYF